MSSPETHLPPADPKPVEERAPEPEELLAVETTEAARGAEEPLAEVTVEYEAAMGAPATADTRPVPTPATAGFVTEPSPTSGKRAPALDESRLLGMKPTRQREQAAWEQVVAVNRAWHAQLVARESLDGELAKGLRMATLERYEDALDAAVAFQLWRRQAKLAKATTAHEVKSEPGLAATLRAEVAAGDFACEGEPSMLEELMEEIKREQVRQRAMQMKREAEAERAAENEAQDED